MVTKSSTTRVLGIDRPRLAFTFAVSKDDVQRLRDEHAPSSEFAVRTLTHIEEETRTRRTRRASLVATPDNNKRWSYHQTMELYSGERLLDRGLCVSAAWRSEDVLDVRWNDFGWELDFVHVRNLVMFNMSNDEEAYWAVRLVHRGKNPHVLDYVPEESPRTFQYAVPLSGLANNLGEGLSIAGTDLHITSSDDNDDVNKLIARLTEKADRESWAASVPKVYGTVVASTPMQAEQHALRRAQFAADLLTFALQTGASHFDTRYENEGLSWGAADAKATVSVHPWILLFETGTFKGWVRTTPLTYVDHEATLRTCVGRIHKLCSKFDRVARAGDIEEQAEIGARSERESRIAGAIQTTMGWLARAAREQGHVAPQGSWTVV